MIDIVGNLLLEMAEKELSEEERQKEKEERLEWEEEERRKKQEEKARLYNMKSTSSMKVNKTNLRRIIKWSSSRYNLMRKEEVVKDILRKIKEGKCGIHTYSCGSFTQSSDMSRSGAYHLVVSPEGAKLIVEDGPVYRLIR